MPLTLEIVTPEARVFSDTIETVVIPTIDGEIGILPGHIPLLTQVADGELRITKNGRHEALVIGDGFAQIVGDKVSILAENAIEETKIDENAVETAMQRAQDALRGAKDLDPAEVERLEGVVRFAVAQLGVKRRGRR
ncbi:MAG TPA: ATP synthase F1 subunit epsilon [Candidatus Synoicihabitans sp.]|nr:ATP synthase F1 subunit epsilon [Candidatus Synoicihabitans sp.]